MNKISTIIPITAILHAIKICYGRNLIHPAQKNYCKIDREIIKKYEKIEWKYKELYKRYSFWCLLFWNPF